MKNNWMRFLSILLCCLLFVQGMPLPVYADEDTNLDSAVLYKEDFDISVSSDEQYNNLHMDMTLKNGLMEDQIDLQDVTIFALMDDGDIELGNYEIEKIENDQYRINVPKEQIPFDSLNDICLQPVIKYVLLDDETLTEQNLILDTVLVSKSVFEQEQGNDDKQENEDEQESSDNSLGNDHEFENNDEINNNFEIDNEIMLLSDDPTLSCELSADGRSVSLSANGFNTDTSVQIVRFAIWSASNGQDDIQWLTAERQNDTWIYSAKISTLKECGLYYVHTYYWDETGREHFVGSMEISIPAPTIEQIDVSDYDVNSDSFSVDLLGLTAQSGIRNVQAAVWCADDQSDIMWYTATDIEEKYHVDVNLINHQFHFGTYKIHVYVTDENGMFSFVGSALKDISISEDHKLMASLSDDGKQIIISLYNYLPAYSNGNVMFAVWSAADGQDDIQWLTASNEGSRYRLAIDTLKLKDFGTYYVHAYYMDKNGSPVFLDSTDFTMDLPSISQIETGAYDENAGTFSVVISGATAATGIKLVSVAVWCADDQSDIMWYTAQKDQDDYKMTVAVSNHKFASGTYKIHIYIQDNTNRMTMVGAASKDIAVNSDQIYVTDMDQNQNQIKISTGFVMCDTVRFAVWSLDGGQDDLHWYTAEKKGSKYEYFLETNALVKTGAYVVHAYGFNAEGEAVFIGMADFTVAKPEIESVNIDRTDSGFSVEINNAVSSAGVQQLRVAVWCNDDQSDLVWHVIPYAGGIYKLDVNLTDHKLHFGTYKTHVYVVDGHGIQTLCETRTYNITLESGSVEVSDSSDEGKMISIGGVTPDKLISGVIFAVWSEKNGQDDIVWHQAGQTGDNYQVTLTPLQMKEGGTFIVHAYARDLNGGLHFLNSSSFVYTPSNLLEVTSMGGTSVKISIYGPTVNGVPVTSVMMPTWTEDGGQSDIVWHTATIDDDGGYYVIIDGMDYGKAGTYITHVYGFLNGTPNLLKTTTYNITLAYQFDTYAKAVMHNIIYAVETGGQVYGNAKYDCFAPAYNISAKETAITIGAGGWFATEAQKLLKLIREANPAEFARLDTAGIGVDLDTADWTTYGSDGNGTATILRGSEKAVCIQKIISSDTGKMIQDQLVDEEMTKYVNQAAALGVTDLKAQMFLANIRHLGGYTPMKWVVNCCKEDGKTLTMQNLYDSMRDHTTNKAGNGVGADKYNSRHTKVMGWLNKYIG